MTRVWGCADRPCRGPRGFVENGGELIYYETHGQGDAIVFTHGMGGNHAVWYRQVPEFSRTHCVVTWDQRGFGRSSNGRKEGGPATAITDLKAVLDALGIERAHLIGQSMGGWPTLGFALAYPNRTVTLVLGDTTAGIRTPAVDRMFDEFASRGGPPPPSRVIGAHPALGERFREADVEGAFLYEEIGEITGTPPGSAWSECQGMVLTAGDLASIGVPALFVVGEEDGIFTPALVEEAASLVRGSQVVVIPLAGHSPYFETPRLWNDNVLGFIRDAGARG